MVGIGFWQLWQGYLDVEDSVRVRARSSAQVVSVNVEWALETARQVLQHVDEIVADPEDPLPPTAAGDLTESVASIPGSPRVYVVDSAGQTLLTTDTDFRRVDITDREYFQKAKQGEEYWISSLLVSRQNGDHIFTVSKRMERNGRFAGVVVLSLTSNLLERVWASLALDSLSTVSLVRDDGWLVSRYPKPEGPLDLRQHVLFTEHVPASPDSGTYSAVSPADGVTRLVAYQRVPGTNLIALASIAEAGIKGEYIQNVQVRLAIGLPVVFLLFAVVAWIARLLKRDTQGRLALEASLAHNQLLMREIHHRVKNHLTGVIGLINLSGLKSAEKVELSDRIRAMASLYASTYEHGDNFDSIDASEYIPRIIDNIAKANAADVDIVTDLASVQMDGEKAMALALIVNEVVTNAFKYAFGGDRRGRLEIRLTVAGEEATLTIADNGPGYDSATVKSGTGSRLIRGFAAKLEGSYQVIADGGTRFVLTFRPGPLAKAESAAG